MKGGETAINRNKSPWCCSPLEQVHFGQVAPVPAQRQDTLAAAYAARPKRFKARPQAGKVPEVVWINAPALPVKAVAEAVAA